MVLKQVRDRMDLHPLRFPPSLMPFGLGQGRNKANTGSAHVAFETVDYLLPDVICVMLPKDLLVALTL